MGVVLSFFDVYKKFTYLCPAKNKKCASRSQRTKNANSDCRQTKNKSIGKHSKPTCGICIFTKFKKVGWRRGQNSPMIESFPENICFLFGISIIPRLGIYVKRKRDTYGLFLSIVCSDNSLSRRVLIQSSRSCRVSSPSGMLPCDSCHFCTSWMIEIPENSSAADQPPKARKKPWNPRISRLLVEIRGVFLHFAPHFGFG